MFVNQQFLSFFSDVFTVWYMQCVAALGRFRFLSDSYASHSKEFTHVSVRLGYTIFTIVHPAHTIKTKTKKTFACNNLD